MVFFSKVIIEAAGEWEDTLRVGIISNNFHIYRSVHIAKATGYENARGIAAKSDGQTLPASMLREFFDVLKDTFYGNMKIF